MGNCSSGETSSPNGRVLGECFSGSLYHMVCVEITMGSTTLCSYSLFHIIDISVIIFSTICLVNKVLNGIPIVP